MKRWLLFGLKETRRSYRELTTILPLLKGKPFEKAGRKAKGAKVRDIHF